MQNEHQAEQNPANLPITFPYESSCIVQYMYLVSINSVDLAGLTEGNNCLIGYDKTNF